jgi:hypothetical protein
METRQTLYFDRPGPKNTAPLLEAVKHRVKELGIAHVVVATNTGQTALLTHEAVAGLGATVIAVTEHAGFNGGDGVWLKPETRKEMEAKGIRIVVATHALSGVERSISKKFGGIGHVEIIAYTLRMMGEGMKVVVEIAVMAADAGVLPTDREAIVLGGTGRGADVAVVLKAAHMNNFFDLEVREILAKPENRFLQKPFKAEDLRRMVREALA